MFIYNTFWELSYIIQPHVEKWGKHQPWGLRVTTMYSYFDHSFFIQASCLPQSNSGNRIDSLREMTFARGLVWLMLAGCTVVEWCKDQCGGGIGTVASDLKNLSYNSQINFCFCELMLFVMLLYFVLSDHVSCINFNNFCCVLTHGISAWKWINQSFLGHSVWIVLIVNWLFAFFLFFLIWISSVMHRYSTMTFS